MFVCFSCARVGSSRCAGALRQIIVGEAEKEKWPVQGPPEEVHRPGCAASRDFRPRALLLILLSFCSDSEISGDVPVRFAKMMKTLISFCFGRTPSRHPAWNLHLRRNLCVSYALTKRILIMSLQNSNAM